MKKTIAVLFIITVTLSMCACRGGRGNPANTESELISGTISEPDDSNHRGLPTASELKKLRDEGTLMGMTEDEVTAILGEPQRFTYLRTTYAPTTSATFPVEFSVYESSDGESLAIAFLGKGNLIMKVHDVRMIPHGYSGTAPDYDKASDTEA